MHTKARNRCDRSQRWLQISEKLFGVSKSLKYGDEASIVKAINKLAQQIRMEASKSPIQITLKAIHVHGWSNVQEIRELTLLPVETVEVVVEELSRKGVISLQPIKKTEPKTYQIVLKKTPFDSCSEKRNKEKH